MSQLKSESAAVAVPSPPAAATLRNPTVARRRRPRNQRRSAQNSDDSQSDHSPMSEDDADADFGDSSDTVIDHSDEVVSSPVSSPLVKAATADAVASQQSLSNREKPEVEDPAFVPKRGVFFMHDYRNENASYRNAAARGRLVKSKPAATVTNPTPTAITTTTATTTANNQPNPAINSQWTHDLHDTQETAKPRLPTQHAIPSQSSSTSYVDVRVSLPGMAKPVVIPKTKLAKHMILPDHRPPLRRDKPVRVFLSTMRRQRCTFPSQERSFIFIPRSLRPNQRPGPRSKGRFFGSVGGYSSHQPSIYNGSSINSPSAAAMSRRSSVAVSPAISSISSRPVVRLPHHATGSTPVIAGNASFAVHQSRNDHFAYLPYNFPSRAVKNVPVGNMEFPVQPIPLPPSDGHMFNPNMQPYYDGMLPHQNSMHSQAYPPHHYNQSPMPYAHPHFGPPPHFDPTSEYQYHIADPFYHPYGYSHSNPEAYFYAPPPSQMVPEYAPVQAEPTKTYPTAPDLTSNKPGISAVEQNDMVYYYNAEQLEQIKAKANAKAEANAEAAAAAVGNKKDSSSSSEGIKNVEATSEVLAGEVLAGAGAT